MRKHGRIGQSAKRKRRKTINKQKKDGNISWTDYTWNPVRGLCPVGCWYCYGRAMYKRFKIDPEIRLANDNFKHMRKFQKLKTGTRVFVCSTIEIFHPVIKPIWRRVIFKIIRENPHLIFQILTKMPDNIDRPMPDNVWLGVTVTCSGNMWRRYEMFDKAEAKVKFVSHEPILGHSGLFSSYKCGWVILGRLTGHGKKRDPSREYLQKYVDWGKKYGVPIFLKNNLKEIWGENPIQEFPE